MIRTLFEVAFSIPARRASEWVASIVGRRVPPTHPRGYPLAGASSWYGLTSKHSSACLALIVASVFAPQTLQAGIVNTFANIEHWTGSGANSAALVIDWADGKEALVWGYRFDTAKASDMLRAVVEADPRLFAKVEQFSFGQFIHGLGYDRNGNGFSISSGTNFGPTGFVISGAREAATSADPNDSYLETDIGFSMTWGVWTGSGNSYPGTTWAEAQVGISDLQLTDQAWSGTRFNSPISPPGIAFAAVPEPSCLLPAILGLSVCHARKRRTR